MDANTEQLEEPTELEKKAMAIINKIQEHLVGEDIALVMSVMANLACVGIRSTAEAQGIGCIGWAYRCADHFAEDVKGGLAKVWTDNGPPQPPAATTSPPRGIAEMAKGWAVSNSGEIDVRTVSPTDIGAMVNWLTVSRGVLIHREVADKDIRHTFNTSVMPGVDLLVQVEIQEVSDHG